MNFTTRYGVLCVLLAIGVAARAQDALPIITVDGQPLAAGARRVTQALQLLGQPLPQDDAAALDAAAKERDSARLQKVLDRHALFVVAINPESRVKVSR